MSKIFYLAYGSNLNIQDMKKRCPSAKIIGTSILNNYHLVYKGSNINAAYLTIEPQKKSIVPIGIYKLNKSDIKNLDYYEGYPLLYSKKYILIKTNRTLKQALIYVMNEEFDYHIPNPSYIETCKKGYDDFGFDLDILEQALQDTKQKIVSTKIKTKKI